MEKIYPDSDEIRLQIGSVMSYLVVEDKDKKMESIRKRKNLSRPTKEKLAELEKQKVAAGKVIDLIIGHYENIEIEKHSENEVLQDIIKECSHVELQTMGRPRITCSMKEFISWLFNHGYINKEKEPGMDEVTAEFIFNQFDSRCKKLETIEKMIREACKAKRKKSG